MVRMILFLILISSNLRVQSQVSGCRVLLPTIDASYEGKCKNGLAHGKGIAQGKDTYEGSFHKGLPQGKGKYTWAGGDWYEGQWNEGVREGRGKMVYTGVNGDSVVNGYWHNNEYVGERLIPPYKISRNVGVIRYNFTRAGGEPNDIKIHFMISGRVNSDIENLSVAYSSGSSYHSGPAEGIMNSVFPVDVKITYRTWNQIHSSQSDVIFEFTISEPGRWNIVLTN